MHYFSKYSNSLRAGLVVLICWGLQSCASSPDYAMAGKTPVAPIAYHPEFGEKPVMLTADELFNLSPEQRATFNKYLKSPRNSGQLRHKRVSNYLKKVLHGFNYHSETLIASEVAETLGGNCMSLAILTTALARAADIEIGYELTQTPPVYQKKGNTILSSQHIRSTLYEPDDGEKEEFLLSLQPVIKIDYFPTKNTIVQRKVREPEFVSMYFRNKAAEALIVNHLAEAYWYARESLKYAENNSHGINILALVYENSGHEQDAEKLYQFGIEHTDDQLELLSNYHRYLIKRERFADAAEVQSKIIEIDEPNPFDWLQMADKSMDNGDYATALKYYDRVVELAPYLHHGYFGRGKAEFMRGNPRRAKAAFTKAAELAVEPETQEIYRAKLSALTRLAAAQ